jgi:mercuric ion transport protein
MSERPKVLGATGGALGLSALALAFGACCVSPWAVTLLGVGGAVLLARLAVVQPYLVAVTLLLVGTSFWYAYRRLPARGGDTCAADNRRGLRRIVWIAAFIIVLVDAVSFVPQFLS